MHRDFSPMVIRNQDRGDFIVEFIRAMRSPFRPLCTQLQGQPCKPGSDRTTSPITQRRRAIVHLYTPDFAVRVHWIVILQAIHMVYMFCLYVLAENHQKSKGRLTQRDARQYGQDGDLCTPCTRARREPYCTATPEKNPNCDNGNSEYSLA